MPPPVVLPHRRQPLPSHPNVVLDICESILGEDGGRHGGGKVGGGGSSSGGGGCIGIGVGKGEGTGNGVGG